MILSDYPVCFNCKHRLGVNVCEAFPDGIPDLIMSEGNMHEKPLPEQDNDIVFEPAE